MITMQWELYSENFPKSGCLVNGECFQRPEWVAPINVKEFSSWLTPSTMDTLPVRSEEALRKQANGLRKGRSTPASLREQVDPEAVKIYAEANWRTPSASDPVGGVKDLNSDKYKNAGSSKDKVTGSKCKLAYPIISTSGGRPSDGQLSD